MLRAALLTLMFAVVPAASAAARADPPVCENSYLLTPVGKALNLPKPVCTGVTQQTALDLVPGSGPSHGTVNSGVYVPSAGYHGEDSFRYTLTDMVNGKSNEFTVNVLVDTPPVCRDTTATVTSGKSLVVPDLDCSDPDGDEFTIWYDDAANGTLTERGLDLIYTPNPGFTGADQFPYFAKEDKWGIESEDAFMRFSVVAAPVIKVVLPTPTPTPTPVPAPPPDRAAPVVSLKNASKKQALAISVTTNENSTAAITVALDKATARKLKLAQKVGTLKAALTPGSSTVKLKLSAKAAKAFKKRKSVRLTVTAVVADAAGNQTTKTLKVTLKK